jgi:adenylylsulfate kinase-like enzyme
MRQRSGTADELNGEEEPEFKAQRPVAHPTKGGIAGTPETIALVMVGLPGRGKTAVAARTARYLSFFHGLECQLFNVGDRRRKGYG